MGPERLYFVHCVRSDLDTNGINSWVAPKWILMPLAKGELQKCLEQEQPSGEKYFPFWRETSILRRSSRWTKNQHWEDTVTSHHSVAQSPHSARLAHRVFLAPLPTCLEARWPLPEGGVTVLAAQLPGKAGQRQPREPTKKKVFGWMFNFAYLLPFSVQFLFHRLLLDTAIYSKFQTVCKQEWIRRTIYADNFSFAFQFIFISKFSGSHFQKNQKFYS